MLALIVIVFLIALSISAFALVNVVRSAFLDSSPPPSSSSGGIGVGAQLNDYPHWNGQERVNILIMGVDQRPGETGSWRTDTMMVLSVDPPSKSAGLLSIPRDLYVEIQNHGMDRINTAYVYGDLDKIPGGGPTLAKRTVQANLGEPIHYYLRVNFSAFQQVVDVVGGVDIYVEREINDPYYPSMNYGYDPLRIPAGWQHMDGALALKYARTRHGSSDFERMRRQQQVLLAVRDKVTNLGLLPRLLPRAGELAKTLGNSIQTDLTFDQLVRLAQLGSEIDRERIHIAAIDQTMTTNWTTPQGANVLIPDRTKMAVLHELIFTAPPAAADEAALVLAEAARIAVLNGTRTNGLAAQAAEKLRAQNLTVVSTGSADKVYAQTLVLVYNGKEATARLAARALGLPASAIAAGVDANAGGVQADIRVIVGADWQP
jgi:LCP family protein required for cell wall assembly